MQVTSSTTSPVGAIALNAAAGSLEVGTDGQDRSSRRLVVEGISGSVDSSGSFPQDGEEGRGGCFPFLSNFLFFRSKKKKKSVSTTSSPGVRRERSHRQEVSGGCVDGVCNCCWI